jgi:hypothetical protein
MIHPPTTKCLLMLVSVALVIPGSVQAAPCATGDNRCVGVLNRDRARAATTEANRARYLYAAHRAFMFAFDLTGDSNDLCESRKAFDEGAKLASESLAERFDNSAPMLAARERAGTATCKPSAPRGTRSKKSSPVPARPAREEATVAPAMRADEGLLAVPGRRPGVDARSTAPAQLATVMAPAAAPEATHAAEEAQGQPVSSRPVTSLPDASRGQHRASQLRVRRMAGGAVLLLASGAFAAGMGASLRARARVNQSIEDLDTALLAQQRNPTAQELASEQGLNAEYRRQTVVAGLMGAAAVLSLGASITLFALSPRRARMAAVPWATPRSAGLTIEGRF